MLICGPWLGTPTARAFLRAKASPDVIRRLVEGLNQGPAYVTGPPLGCPWRGTLPLTEIFAFSRLVWEEDRKHAH